MRELFKQAAKKHLPVADFDPEFPEYNTAYVSADFPGPDFTTIFVYVKTASGFNDIGLLNNLNNQTAFVPGKDIKIMRTQNRFEDDIIRTFVYTAR